MSKVPGTIPNNCPNSETIAIVGTKSSQWMLCFEIVLFQTANKIERYENNQRPSGSEYKNQLGRCSVKGCVNNLSSDMASERLILSNQLNIFKVSCRNDMYTSPPNNKVRKCPMISWLFIFLIAANNWITATRRTYFAYGLMSSPVHARFQYSCAAQNVFTRLPPHGHRSYYISWFPHSPISFGPFQI